MKKLCVFLRGNEEGNEKIIILIHINLMIYAFSYWIHQTILPYLSKELGAGIFFLK
jgi:hypothetical protein